MHMKKTLSLLLAGTMMLSLAACGGTPSQPSETPAPALYKAGTYTAEAQGYGGPIKVELTVSESAITDVKITGEKETAGVGSNAVEKLPEAIKTAQSAEVEVVAGATISSGAIKTATQKCLDQAMGKEAPATAGYKPGTYKATVKGHRGEMTVEVTLDETSIKEVKVTDNKETYGLGWGLSTSPIEVLPGAIVAAQSLAVDSVASATVTSAAIKQAVAECVTQAGGDAEALKSAPAPKADAKDEQFDVDIVVIGAGAAGLSAANTALEAGKNVLVLEKVGVTGGSTTRSGGKILAAGTTWQEKQDQVDSADMMYDFLMSYDRDGLMNPDLVRAFCDNSKENLQWLEDRGVKVKDVEPIHSSLTPLRVHNTEGGGGMTDGIGGQICVPLTNAYEKAGGKIIYNCRATELVTDTSGAVVGVKGEKTGGGNVTVNAKSVIIATGGFAKSPELMATYQSFLPANYSGVPDTNVGDGLLMAQKVGAKSTVNPGLQLVYLNYDAYIGIAEESGLITDVTGKRVVNEWTYQSHVASALARANSPVGYYITATKDGVCAEPYKMVQYGVTMTDKIPNAPTIEELATLIGVDPATLKGTVDRYNELCKKGKDDDFGKPADYMIPVEGDTYYAFMMNDGSSVTFGGLEIDTSARVLDAEGNPISGLYAAGEVAHTGLFSDEYPCCGMAIGSAVYYGRVAAETASKS